jgi:hypothetical protein
MEVLYIDNDDENELIFQMLAVLEPMIYFGYCWNVDDDLKFDLEETLIPMLDPSTDQTDNCKCSIISLIVLNMIHY